jgi:hypothetical protein
MTATQPVPSASPVSGGPVDDLDSVVDLTRGAVDVFDIAARLEASGLSDRSAISRHGRSDIFDLAAHVHRSEGWSMVSGPRRRTPSGMGEAFRRAVLLLCGALLAAAVLGVLRLPTEVVWLVGAIGWVGGQAVAAIGWTRLGWGQGPLGLRRAGGAALLLVALAAITPQTVAPDRGTAVTAGVLCVTWVAYAGSVPLLVCARRTQLALWPALAGLLVVGGAVLADRPESDTVVLAAGGATSAVVVSLAAWAVLRAGRPQLPRLEDWRAALPAVLQAALLSTSLLLLVQTVPTQSAAPLVVASVVGAATADPAIAILRAHLRRSASRLFLLAAAAREARRAAVVAAASTAAVSALAAVIVVLVLRAGTPDWWATVVPAAAFTSVATTAAVLTALGAPVRAVLAAALATLYAGSAFLIGALTAGIVFPFSLVLAVVLLLHRVSDPRVAA